MDMAMSGSNEENQIKVSGDLGDFQISEEDLETESDDDEDSNSSAFPSPANALSTIPQDLIKPSAQAVFGSVQVTQSENVQFGNNVYFNGPVVIKQVVHSKEHDNPGYTQTEDDAPRNKPEPSKPVAKVDAEVKSLNLQLWVKVSFSAICFIIVAGVCAIVTVTMTYTRQDNSTTVGYDDQETSTSCVMVKGYYYELLLILMSILLVIVTISMCGTKLLTKRCGSGNHCKPKAEEQNNCRKITADPLFISPTHLRVVSRTDWLAQPVEKPLDKIRLPVPWVIIQHTATESCHIQSECVLSVRLIQAFHVESRGWYDIGYNFLVGGDGSAYIGRGWEYEGAHTLGYNKYSMGIAFIGTFNNEAPPQKQLEACKKLIQKGVELGKIAPDYKLFAHRQLASTLSPGDKLVDELRTWPHFVHNVTNTADLLPKY